MNWTESDEKQLQDLKEKLSSAPVLSLPDLKKEFDLFVNTEKGIAYGVLTQEWGGYRKPVAFLSKLLDPVARGWPACLQAVAAAAILIEEAQKLTLQGKIKIHTPHDLKTILSQRAQKWLTDSRILKYEIILINTDNLELTTSKSLNPAQFLSGEPTEEIEHHGLELIDMQTKVREDLEDTPLPYGRVLFTDGSSRVVEGKRTSGYSVIEGEKMEVLEKGKLPSNCSKDYLEGEEVTRKYLKTIGQTPENLRKKGYLPQTSPLDANVHNINPGDWVLIKTWTNTPLTLKFEGPYQVLLTTHTAVCTEEKGWTHITRVKGPEPPPGENPSSAPSPDETEWTVTPHPKDLKLTFKKK
ncbi:hypothetical protein DUI87_06162 [Hirundo rustica rustica]|uniref:Reverse transcriptase/retrotransposon-derived protein RNase H-like domain-containing protein n=1 Tax=Hirundo rustica rustica TaxID=333673 RepID=A0A3M0LCR6_HIRRU|nr:hypothetical protein DUI87_06162 [Hirundo rustica rustica]